MNVDHAIYLLRQRANDRLSAAKRQSKVHKDFAIHCRSEARFFNGVADCIEQLQHDIVKERMNRVLDRAGSDGNSRPLPEILKGLR